MSESESIPKYDREAARRRRERLIAQAEASGKRPLTVAEIRALQAADDDGFPDKEEYDAWMAEIYDARDRDLARRLGNE